MCSGSLYWMSCEISGRKVNINSVAHPVDVSKFEKL